MTACLYMRMSTDKQENSIDSQRAALTAYAKQRRMFIAREYVDEGISGRKADKRPAFMQMIEDSQRREFGAVLIYDSSRFARNLEESLVYKSLLAKNGVSIVSATEPASDDEDTALLTDALMGAVNEMFSRKLSKAVKRGMNYRIEQGYYQNTPPYGYGRVFVDGVPPVDPEQAAVVRLIFEKFTGDTPSFIGIVRYLNDNGYRTARGSYWDIKGIKTILTNTTYIGRLPWSANTGEAYHGRHEAIISPEQFERARELYDRRIVARRPRDCGGYRHWLSGLIFCSRCGKVMAFNRNSQKPQYHVFRCIYNARGLCRPRNAIFARKAETLIISALNEILEDDYRVRMDRIVFQTDSETPLLQKQLDKLAAKLRRQREAYEGGVDTLDEYRSNKAETTREIASVTDKINSLKNRAGSEQTILASLREKASGAAEFVQNGDNTIAQKSTAMRGIVHHINYDQVTGEFEVFFVS